MKSPIQSANCGVSRESCSPKKRRRSFDAKRGRELAIPRINVWCWLVLCGAALLTETFTFAESNLSSDQVEAWSANTGWMNWQPDLDWGVEVGQYICAGNIYSANLGWISVGNGAPVDGIAYRNSSGSDFGVNVDSQGNLRGLAYGANIGWINFESSGAPRVDLTSGKLSGFAYGANIGWINLGDGAFSLKVDYLASGSDSDQDGIPDAWELFYAGNLTTFDATTDSDHDGQSDLEEYLAGTDPLDPNDCLRIISYSMTPDQSSSSIRWTSKPTRQYRIESSSELLSPYAWSESTLGLVIPDGNITARLLPASDTRQFLRIKAVRPLMP